MQGTVELPVAAAAEAVPRRLAAGGRDRGDAGEPGEGGNSDRAGAGRAARVARRAGDRARSRLRCAAARAPRDGRRRRCLERPVTVAVLRAAVRTAAAPAARSRTGPARRGRRRARRPCRATAARSVTSGQPRAPPRRARSDSGQGRRRSDRCLQPPTREHRPHTAPRIAAPARTHGWPTPFAARQPRPPARTTTARTCSSRCVSTPTT